MPKHKTALKANELEQVLTHSEQEQEQDEQIHPPQLDAPPASARATLAHLMHERDALLNLLADVYHSHMSEAPPVQGMRDWRDWRHEVARRVRAAIGEQ